jgi:arsenate reductase (glutaredoxin)
MADLAIYGIKACDTMKKARAWLDDQGLAYDFHDYKVEGADRARLEAWADRVGWATLLNQPSMIKRPVLEAGGELLVGFKPERYAAAFAK